MEELESCTNSVIPQSTSPVPSTQSKQNLSNHVQGRLCPLEDVGKCAFICPDNGSGGLLTFTR